MEPHCGPGDRQAVPHEDKLIDFPVIFLPMMNGSYGERPFLVALARSSRRGKVEGE